MSVCAVIIVGVTVRGLLLRMLVSSTLDRVAGKLCRSVAALSRWWIKTRQSCHPKDILLKYPVQVCRCPLVVILLGIGRLRDRPPGLLHPLSEHLVILRVHENFILS